MKAAAFSTDRSLNNLICEAVEAHPAERSEQFEVILDAGKARYRGVPD